MTKSEIPSRGRRSFGRQEWTDAYNQLSAADGETPLAPEDLELLATAAYLIGKDAESDQYWVRAHHDFQHRGDLQRAAACAFWMAYGLLHRGERARASGWISRARRLVEDLPECVEQGFLLLPAALQYLTEGEIDRAYTTFCQAAEIGDRTGNPDLIALACHSRGRVLIRLGKIEQGVELLDEAMVAVEAGGVSPMAAGDVYCSVVEGCLEIFDLRRAQEWTAALNRWCESQPDLVSYSGECLVRRSEILELHGTWSDAFDAAKLACERLLRGSGRPAAGAAFYRCAELHRLRGEFEEAEDAYRQASRWGRKPQPGLALLRLAQGQVDTAEAAIRRVMDEAQDRITRSRLLPVFIDIMLAAGDVQAAGNAADELSELAADLNAQFLNAAAAHARGAVLLAGGDASSALQKLRDAWVIWQDLEAPYEAARVRVLIGLACRELGDEDTARMEFDAASWVFCQIGALPEVSRVDSLVRITSPEVGGGLTSREIEVLRLVAAGNTNRAIAEELFLSEKTVARHISNIFNKLDLSNRAEATAYAYEHDLV